MRVGSIVYATDQGIGIIAKAFYDHTVLTDVIVYRHSSRLTHTEWYPSSKVITDFRRISAVHDFCRSMDAMLFFETPFFWELIPYCKAHGVKTFLVPNHECTPKAMRGFLLPDVLLCPSALEEKIFGQYEEVKAGACKVVRVQIPVNVTWHQRNYAKVFVHNAGHGGLRGRNGTDELLQALGHVRSPAKFIIRSQHELPKHGLRECERFHRKTGGMFDLVQGTVPHSVLFSEGDVFVFPEKFQGQSCPLEEAYASGMLVMATDRFPNNQYLPTEPLILVERLAEASVAARMLSFQEAVIDPRTIAATIDYWYGRDITEFSERGRVWGEQNSWDVLEAKYKELLKS